MKNEKTKRVLQAVCAAAPAAAMLLFSDSAAAATAGQVADNIRGQFGSIADMIGGASYIMGAGFGVRGALKLKEHNENPSQVKLSQPLTALAVSGALLALPSVMDTGAESTFGSESRKTSVNGLGN